MDDCGLMKGGLMRVFLYIYILVLGMDTKSSTITGIRCVESKNPL